jgi:hypothetical protein
MVFRAGHEVTALGHDGGDVADSGTGLARPRDG